MNEALKVWVDKPYSRLKEIHREDIGMGSTKKKKLEKARSSHLFKIMNQVENINEDTKMAKIIEEQKRSPSFNRLT